MDEAPECRFSFPAYDNNDGKSDNDDVEVNIAFSDDEERLSIARNYTEDNSWIIFFIQGHLIIIQTMQAIYSTIKKIQEVW